MNNIKRGKYVVLGTLMLVFLGVLYAWSYFKSAIQAEFPQWNQKQLSLNFSIMMICFAAGGLLGGRLMRKTTPTILAACSGTMLLIGFLVMSLLPRENAALSLLLMYVFYGGFTGLGVGVGYTAVLSGVNSWFPDKDGLVSGILLTGFGLGSLLLGLAADAMIRAGNLFLTFRVLGVSCGAVVFLGAFFLRAPDGSTPLPPAKTKGSVPGGKDYTTGEMIRRPTFWLYFLWNLCMSATGMLVINNAASISLYFGAAATIGLLVSVFNSGGRLLIGLSMDHFGWKITMFLANGTIILAGILMEIGNCTGTFALVLIGMLLTGISYGGGVTIQASLVRSFYGSEYYPMNFSTCNLVAIPAALVGPMISAALVDAAGGAFGSTFIMVVVMGIVSLGVNFLIRRP